MTGSHEIFGLMIGCSDGRTHGAQEKLLRYKYNVTALDKLTKPGIVKRIVNDGIDDELAYDIGFLIAGHNSHVVVVSGHQECAGNPTDDVSHREQVQEATRIVREIIPKAIPLYGSFIQQRTEGEKTVWVARLLPPQQRVLRVPGYSV